MSALVRVAALLALMSACELTHNRGGEGPSSNPDLENPATADGSPPDGVVQTSLVSGTVCALSSPTSRESCTPLTGSSLTVTLDSGGEVPVSENGAFALPGPGTAGIVTLSTSTADETWFGAAINVELDATGSAAGIELPVLSRSTIDGMLSASNVTMATGEGILLVHVDKAGSPVSDAQLGTVQGVLPSYDTDDDLAFSSTASATGARGTAVYFGLTPGTFSYTVTLVDSTNTYASFAAANALVLAEVSLP